MSAEDQHDDEAGETQRPSKGARKRAALAAQDLGEELVSLKDAELDALGLPEPVADAIREARRLKSRSAFARQRQYIGKLMRGLDLEPIREVLDSKDKRNSIEAQRFKRIESWRDRLLREGAAGVTELARWHPGIDAAEWQRRVAAAQDSKARGDPAGPRDLFRALRDLLG